MFNRVRAMVMSQPIGRVPGLTFSAGGQLARDTQNIAAAGHPFKAQSAMDRLLPSLRMPTAHLLTDAAISQLPTIFDVPRPPFTAVLARMKLISRPGLQALHLFRRRARG